MLRIALNAVVVVCVVVGFGLSSASPAAALTVQRSVVNVDDSYKTTDICSFPIVVSDRGSYVIDLFENANGDVLRELDTPKGPFVETYTAKGVTLRTKEVSYTEETVYNSQGFVKFVISGIYIHVVLPGQGVVLSTVGHFVFDDSGLIQSGGPDQSFTGDFGSFCAAF
jgi:hypothetical protein